MPWPVPAPETITARAAAVYSSVYPDFNPTSANTLAGTHCRVLGLSGFDLYGYIAYQAQELFPDTTQDNLDHHCSIWGLTRIPPQAAVGSATAAGETDTSIPTGTIATDPIGNAYITTAAATWSGTTATAAFQAVSAGGQGNLAAGTLLTLLSPIAGLAPQTFTVSTPGFAGGAPAEQDDPLRARLLQRIRQRGRGGNNADYTYWAEASSSAVAYVDPVPNYLGLGSVGIFVAGIGPSMLSGGELTTISNYIAGVRPITVTQCPVYSATTQTLNGTIHLVPDTAANRVAAANGFASWVVTTAEIGGTQYVDDMAAAIKAALGGAASFDISEPSADVVCGIGTICVAGTLSFD
jgi:uncharacterized phage protein gp47/JayE